MARKYRNNRGQAVVELALLGTVAMIVLVVGVQYAVIGEVSISLSQMNYQGARYAAANEGCDASGCTGASAGNQSVRAYMLSVGSGIFNSNSSLLTVSATPAPRIFGQALTVSSTFTLPGKILFLPNPFMGIVPFPTHVSAIQTQSSD